MRRILILINLLYFTATLANTPRVTSSIYPLQQIANAITGYNTDLVVNSYLSPHKYTMKPSDINIIKNADIFLWVGKAIMPQLDKYIYNRKGITITASKINNIQLLKDEHNGDHSDENEHDSISYEYDPHLWISTVNAYIIAKELTNSLIKVNPESKSKYINNLSGFKKELEKTKSKINNILNSSPKSNYFTFHNAYSYFEKEFNIKNSGAVKEHSGQKAKTRHLYNLENKLKRLSKKDIVCIFREPQFDSSIIKKLAERANIKVSSLDPVGYKKDINIGYFAILENIALQIAKCGK